MYVMEGKYKANSTLTYQGCVSVYVCVCVCLCNNASANRLKEKEG
jgi:hypothetical protein